MGKPRNTQKYPTYPEIPEIPGNTRKKKRYPEIPDRIFRHSYPTQTRPATRYFVQYLTRPDPILKNPTRWALNVCNNAILRCRMKQLGNIYISHDSSPVQHYLVVLSIKVHVHLGLRWRSHLKKYFTFSANNQKRQPVTLHSWQ